MRGSAGEVAQAPRNDVDGYGDDSQPAVDFAAVENRVRGAVRNHNQKIKAAVRPRVASCVRAEEPLSFGPPLPQ